MSIDTIPLVINGERLTRGGGGTSESLDPATGRPIAYFAVAGPEDADAAVAAARHSFAAGTWRGIKPFERGRVMQRIAAGLLERRGEIARLLTLDSGKPLRDAYWEVDCSSRFFEFYGGYCDKIQGAQVPLGPGWMDWTVRDPIGVSVHIVPWNYPLQVAVRGIAPALAAGCSVVAKPSMETPGGLSVLADIAEAAGLPAGVLNVVTGPGSTVGDRLARHRDVDQLTFTGSVGSGIKVIQAAATHTIPTTMELGGKSPQLVFADADLERTVPQLMSGMYTHAGQVCNAGTRLLVHASVHDEVVKRLHAGIKGMRLGHGLTDPDMGPVISQQQRDGIQGYLELAATEGMVLVGAELPSDEDLRGGYFVRPALVTGIGNDARIAQEEIFGPLLAVIPFETTQQALDMANDSEFGLVAGVFTGDVSTAMTCASELRAGQVWVNSFGIGLDVEFPFGGFKRSGFGREKGLESIAAYLQVKNICVGY
ncbi:MAG: aldehyde dehydrogenase family protein [Candidatus Dormibacteria bacterium]